MNATKCDRCGQYYDGDIPKIIYKENSFQSPHCYDICPECLEAFLRFIHALEGGENDT